MEVKSIFLLVHPYYLLGRAEGQDHLKEIANSYEKYEKTWKQKIRQCARQPGSIFLAVLLLRGHRIRSPRFAKLKGFLDFGRQKLGRRFIVSTENFSYFPVASSFDKNKEYWKFFCAVRKMLEARNFKVTKDTRLKVFGEMAELCVKNHKSFFSKVFGTRRNRSKLLKHASISRFETEKIGMAPIRKRLKILH